MLSRSRRAIVPSNALPGSADVVVIGGGVMGTSTAYFLSERTDRDVVLLEKDAIGSGSTGDSSAILRHHYGNQTIYAKMAAWSHDFYRDFEARTGEAIAREENPLLRLGERETASGRYVRAGYDVLTDLGLPVTWFEADELPEEYPMLRFDGVDFGVQDDAAAYSDGADVAGGFARAAQNNGVTVVTGVEVEGFETHADAVEGVVTEEGTIASETVVVTAGPWTPELVESVGVDVPITRSREQVIVLDPSADYRNRYSPPVPTFSPAGGNWYARADFDEGVLVATHHTDETVEDPDTVSDSVDEHVLLDLTDSLEAYVPDLTTAGLRGDYCGVYSTTPDHDFIIDQVGPAGLYLGCGFSGHGFKHAPAVGHLLTDMVTGEETTFLDIDREYFGLSRFESDPMGHGPPEDRV